MAALRIPVLNGRLANRLTVELDGGFYTLSFRWNARNERWFVDVYQNEVLILAGTKVVATDNLFGQYDYMKVDGRLPPGVFQVLDQSGLYRDPDTVTFGEDVLLMYNEAA